MMSTTSRVRASGLPNGWPYQPSTTCGPLTPMPRIIRPLDRWSRVSACMAIDVGVRPDICTMEVPSFTRLVSRPHHASGVKASLPHASAANTASKPESSAAATSSPTPSGGCAPQYPAGVPASRPHPAGPLSRLPLGDSDTAAVGCRLQPCLDPAAPEAFEGTLHVVEGNPAH